jgi:hypothetical protein
MRTFRQAIAVLLPWIVMRSLAAQTNTEIVFQCDMNIGSRSDNSTPPARKSWFAAN